MKNIVIATGGTGGHIYPALAFADRFKKRHPDYNILFVGSLDRMEATLIPQHGYAYYGVDMVPSSGSVSSKMKAALTLTKAKRWCRCFLREVQPECCIGFGNYISVPLILAAASLKIPTMIHEQNSFAGKANRLLGKVVKAIATSYPSTLSVFDKKKTRVLGNPQASLAKEIAFDESLLPSLGLRNDRKTIVCMMGSLGSSSVSKAIDEALCDIDQDVQIVVAVGKANPYEFKTKSDDRIKIVPYVDGIQMLKACDLAITRAGATTLCELTAIGCPAILIPSPYVPNNHQVKNALELVNENAAVMLEEKDLSNRSLSALVNSLIRDEARLKTMQTQALRLGKGNAADDMVDWVEEFLIR